jgi:serine protease Do
VTSDQTLSYLVSNVTPGQVARLDVIRNSRPTVVNVTVAARPSQEQLAALVGGGSEEFGADDDDTPAGAVAPTSGNALGLTVQPLTPAIARAPAVNVDATVQGVVIAQVDPSSDAAWRRDLGD